MNHRIKREVSLYGTNQSIFDFIPHFYSGVDSSAEYLKKNHYFKPIGEHCYIQPWNLGTEPYLISFGENVRIASGVVFANHDITALMFRYMDKIPDYQERKGPISIGDNDFVSANTTILYDVNIGNNVIIGAGSLVNKDIPDGTVAAGVP